MFSSYFRQTLKFSSLSLAITFSFTNIRHISHSESRSIDETDDKYVSLCLSENSQIKLKEYTDKNKLNPQHGRLVILKVLPYDNLKTSQYVYEPLFGEKAAFRLKGIATNSSNGLIMGFGRVSIFTGELRDDDLIPIIPLDSNHASNITTETMTESIQFTHDLLSHGLIAKMNNSQSQNESVTMSFGNSSSVVIFPFDKQIVLDGRICRNDLFDKDGSCDFDRSQLQDIDENLVDDSKIIIPPASSSETEESIDNNKTECPVCKFMKGGQCKDEFITWDECMSQLKDDDDVKKCYTPTVTMMNCMKKYEYYDIMVAGTSYDSNN